MQYIRNHNNKEKKKKLTMDDPKMKNFSDFRLND